MQIHWPHPTNAIGLWPNTLDVWAVRLEGGCTSSTGLSALLSAAEQERADEFRLDEPRHRFVVTRAALRMLLGRYLGRPAREIELETDSRGKPRLARRSGRGDLRFNVAHSGSLALIAATDGCDVGVDVERVRTISRSEHIARRFFHPAETKAILAAEPSSRDAVFLRCWTCKEALLKAIGSGVTGSLASFRVPTAKFQTAWIDLPAPLFGDHLRGQLRELMPCEGYIGAVACFGEERVVRQFAFDFQDERR